MSAPDNSAKSGIPTETKAPAAAQGSLFGGGKPSGSGASLFGGATSTPAPGGSLFGGPAAGSGLFGSAS